MLKTGEVNERRGVQCGLKRLYVRLLNYYSTEVIPSIYGSMVKKVKLDIGDRMWLE